jgi:hypothetical protein
MTLATRGLLAVAFLLAVGCSAARVPPSAERQLSQPARLVARAAARAGAGDGRGAQYLYQQVVREFPGDRAAAAALYGLGRLETDPASGVRDYRAAYAAFSQLLADYPQSGWAPEACAWQATLADLLGREEEAASLSLQLRWREAETARLRLQLQQLRSVDLDLERQR